jgi:glycosyltransferase involved in cell wall biosynthesis
MSRMPVIIAGTNCRGGVTTWSAVLRTLLADHPRYVVRLLHVGRGRDKGEFDLVARTVADAERLVRELAPAIVIPNYVWELYLAGFAPGVKCIGMCHADDDEQYYRPLSWYEPLATKFVAVSPECGARLVARLPCRSQDIAVLPYGVHVPRSLARDYRMDPLRLVYAGRVTQLQKRVRDLVPLVEELVKAGVPFEFDIVGEGDEFDPLRAALAAVAPVGRVRFHPRVPHAEMPRIWTGHDVFVQVSDFEGTSVSMLEAMAHGLVPVVTAASSGIAGVIHDGANGFVVPVGDMPALARAIARLAMEPGQLARLGRAAHESAQAYALEPYRDRFVALLDAVVRAPDGVNLAERYGMFGYAHPLFKLHQQRRVAESLLEAGYRKLVPAGVRRYLAVRRGGGPAESA